MMKITISLLILMASLLPSHGNAQEIRPAGPPVVMRPAPLVPVETSVSFAGQAELAVLYDDALKASILKFDRAQWTLPVRQQVRQVAMNSSRTLALLLVQSHAPGGGGWYYTGILCVQRREGKFEFSWRLTDEEMRNIDGRRRSVFEILEVDEFPKVKLKVCTYEKPQPPTRLFTEEEWWDMLKLPLELPRRAEE